MRAIRAIYGNRWARYGLTLLLLAIVVWRVQPGKVATSIGSANAGYLLAALALTVPFLFLKILRWHLMLRASSLEAGFGDATRSLIGGMGLALVTPARLGEVVRAAYVPDARKFKIGGLVMVDKGFDVLVLAGLSIAGAWVLLGHWAGVLLALATVAGLALVYFPRFSHRSLLRLSQRAPGRSKLEEIWSCLDALSPATTSAFLLVTVLAFAIVLVQFGVILLSWHGWSFEIVFYTFPLVVLTNILPITIGGLGVREGAAALLLNHYGVSPAHAALAAFLMFFINTALPGLVGAFILPKPAREVPTAPNDGAQRRAHNAARPIQNA